MKPEEIEQCKLFDWIRTKPELERAAFHIANERQCSVQRGRILKRMGVRPGVSDIFIGIARGKYHGLFIELKYGSNKPTALQERFMLDMSAQGYYCVWVQGFEAAKMVIENYLLLHDE